jgi:IclR family KDG regulon transcriptional repressor
MGIIGFDIEKQPSKTVAKALVILDQFNFEKKEWGVRELAREIGESNGTVYRIAKTLQNAGFLIQEDVNQKYMLGPKALKLATTYSIHNPLPSLVLEIFKEYSDRFEFNFYLGTLNQFEVIYLAVLDGRGPVKIVEVPGGTIALHSTAIGKVLLAFRGDDFIQNYLNEVGLPSYTKRTIIEKQELWKQIGQIRDKGYSINYGEHYSEIGAIGVPVFASDDTIQYGVSLAYPQHFAETGKIDINELIPLASEIAAEISARSVELGVSALQSLHHE